MSAPVLHVIACAHGTHDAAGRDVIDGLRADLADLLAAEGPGAQVHIPDHAEHGNSDNHQMQHGPHSS